MLGALNIVINMLNIKIHQMNIETFHSRNLLNMIWNQVSSMLNNLLIKKLTTLAILKVVL